MPIDDLPPDLHTLLSEISRVAGDLGIPTYLVGGAVRDLLLERPCLDVDVAVDGDALALGRALADALPAALQIHEAFGTAALETAGGYHLDLASVRGESYATDASLPTVFPSSLHEDLLRRDFTVNSMALALEDLGYPELVDPSGGRQDLALRVLRVHHARSFLDDPTRILRGVRLEARLGLGFEPQTEAWAREAVESRVFDLLSRDRLVGELELLFDEECDLAAMWRRLDGLGVLGALGFEPAPEAPELMAGVRGAVLDFRTRYEPRFPISTARALVRAAVLGQPRERRGTLLERLGADRKAAADLERLEELPGLLEQPELAPHQAYRALEELSAEALAVLLFGARPGTVARVYQHLDEQRALRLEVDGEALLRRGFAPGPAIGRALRATHDARLDGRIAPDEELAFAVEQLRTGEGG